MGRDNHPRQRQAEKLARHQGKRTILNRTLIVCEGRKTEPSYFNEIRQEYRLHSASVAIFPGGYGTSPKQVVEYANDLFFKGNAHLKIEKRYFEKVYIVFDRDEHRSYYDALKHITALNEKKMKNDQNKAASFEAIEYVNNFV